MTYASSFLIFISLLTSFSAFASKADQILAVWWSPEQKTKVEIKKQNEIYYGQIIALRPESKEMKDTNNPDSALQARHILGLEILTGFKFDGDDTWEDGSIYDPESGKTYKCKMWLKNNDILKIRGYIGFSLLGRTVEFTRVTGEHPDQQQADEPVKVYLNQK